MSNGVCPVCQARFPLEAALTDSQAREAVAAALKLPAPLGDRLIRYMSLFRPATRAISWERFTRLLNELQQCISTAQITRDGISWAAPVDTWKQALDITLDARPSLTLPLKDHGYLFSIVARLAGKAAAKEEARVEHKRKHGTDQSRTGAATQVGEVAKKITNTRKPPPAGWRDVLKKKVNDDD